MSQISTWVKLPLPNVSDKQIQLNITTGQDIPGWMSYKCMKHYKVRISYRDRSQGIKTTTLTTDRRERSSQIQHAPENLVQQLHVRFPAESPHHLLQHFLWVISTCCAYLGYTNIPLTIVPRNSAPSADKDASVWGETWSDRMQVGWSVAFRLRSAQEARQRCHRHQES